MAILENSASWSLTSSGASTQLWVGLETAQNVTLVVDVSGGTDTCVVGIEHGWEPASTGHFSRLGSTAYSVSSGASVTIQLNGPMAVIRPYLIAKTAATTTVRIRGLAN